MIQTLTTKVKRIPESDLYFRDKQGNKLNFDNYKEPDRCDYCGKYSKIVNRVDVPVWKQTNSADKTSRFTGNYVSRKACYNCESKIIEELQDRPLRNEIYAQ